jgi:hypothetical protein
MFTFSSKFTEVAGLLVVAIVLFCFAVNVKASSRRDIASAYLACSSVGERLTDLRASFASAGVIFERTNIATSRVGYTHCWFLTRWLCRLSVDDAGVVVSSERLH